HPALVQRAGGGEVVRLRQREPRDRRLRRRAPATIHPVHVGQDDEHVGRELPRQDRRRAVLVHHRAPALPARGPVGGHPRRPRPAVRSSPTPASAPAQPGVPWPNTGGPPPPAAITTVPASPSRRTSAPSATPRGTGLDASRRTSPFPSRPRVTPRAARAAASA